MPSFTTTTMKAFADAACERKFAPVLKPHELIHNAITTMGKPRTDKTGGAEGADWEMETHGLDVAKDYFDKEKIAAWKEAALLPLVPIAAGLFGFSAGVATGGKIAGVL